MALFRCARRQGEDSNVRKGSFHGDSACRLEGRYCWPGGTVLAIFDRVNMARNSTNSHFPLPSPTHQGVGKLSAAQCLMQLQAAHEGDY